MTSSCSGSRNDDGMRLQASLSRKHWSSAGSGQGLKTVSQRANTVTQLKERRVIVENTQNKVSGADGTPKPSRMQSVFTLHLGEDERCNFQETLRDGCQGIFREWHHRGRDLHRAHRSGHLKEAGARGKVYQGNERNKVSTFDVG